MCVFMLCEDNLSTPLSFCIGNIFKKLKISSSIQFITTSWHKTFKCLKIEDFEDNTKHINLTDFY